MSKQEPRWKNWSDHPLVVAIGIISGTLAIIGFLTGINNLRSLVSSMLPRQEQRSSNAAVPSVSPVNTNRLDANTSPLDLEKTIWLVHYTTSANGKPVYYQFKSGGKIIEYDDYHPKGFLLEPAYFKWSRDGDTINVSMYALSSELKKHLVWSHTGSIKDDRIEGTSKFLVTGETKPWLLTKKTD